MSYERNPIGMGQATMASMQRPAAAKTGAPTLLTQAVPFRKSPGTTIPASAIDLSRSGTVVSGARSGQGPFQTTMVPMTLVGSGEVVALKTWLLRQYGAGNKEYQYLAVNPRSPRIETSLYSKFKDAQKRAKSLRADAKTVGAVSQKMAKSLGLNVAKATQDTHQLLLGFMSWWQQCEKTSWAAWDQQVIGSPITNLVPKKAFEYWQSRRATQTLPAVISGISVATGVIAPMATATVGGQRVAQAAEAEGVRRIAAVMTMTPLYIAPTQVATTPVATSAIILGTNFSTQSMNLPGSGRTGTMPPAMRGMGQSDPAFMGRTTSQTRAKIREEMRKRRSERRLARIRRRTERRACAGLAGQAATSCALARAQRRLLARQISGDIAGRLQAERATRANVVASTLGHKSKVVPSVRAGVAQRRAQNTVPCPVGNLKNEIFGMPHMVTIPGTATGVSDNLARIREARAAAEAARRRRLQAIPLPVMPTSPPFVPGTASIHDWIEARIREILANSENSVVATEDKEDQVAKLEDILDEIKEQLDEALEAQTQGKATAEEVKALREQVDKLTAMLEQAQQELLDASQKSEEANVEQINALRLEIENLKSMLVSGQVTGTDAIETQTEVVALEQDVASAQEDVLDAQTQTAETQLDIQSTEQAVVETSQEIGDTRPWMERNRTLLIVAGIGLTVAGYYFYRKGKIMRQLPPPSTMERPSGL